MKAGAYLLSRETWLLKIQNSNIMLDEMNFSTIGKILIFIGIGIIILGGLLWLFSRIPFAGKLPGDITIKKENFSFYFPITTCIIISIVITVILNIALRFFLKK